MRTLIGIDPGLDGAVAYIRVQGSTTYDVWDTPTLTVAGKNGNKREYNLALMATLLRPFTQTECQAWIELVHSSPQMGVRSAFTMGYGLAAWEATLSALTIPFQRVLPPRWKKTILADMGRDKDASRVKATQLFPELAHAFKRKKDDGRAEAILIAEYGRRTA